MAEAPLSAVPFSISANREEGAQMTQLLAVNTENRPRYGAFEKSYDTCLKEYMSRIFPHRADRFAELTEAGLLLWDYILCG